MEIPEWLQAKVNVACPYCGHPLINNQLLTDRYCSNPSCPEHLAQKVVALAKYFNIPNIGAATARELVRVYKLSFHTQIIPYWFKEPPTMQLHEIGEICMIKGCQKKWREYCDGHDTMLQVLQDPRTPAAIKKQGVLLVYTEGLCNVKPRLQGKRLNVMLSGSFDNYKSRADFITDMNNKYGDVVQLVDIGKRKTDVAFLVKEEHATDHEKSAIALASGIPIITPSCLDEKLAAYRTYILGGDKSEH